MQQQSIRCARCGSPNYPGQQYCWNCGTQMGNVCNSCGAPMEPNAKFCSSCGNQQSGGYQSPPEQQPYTQQQYGQGGGQQQGYQQGGWTPPAQQWNPPQGGYQNQWSSQRSSSTPLVILLIVLLIGLGGFAYWAFLGPGFGTSTASPLQIKTGPFINASTDNTTPTRSVTINFTTGAASVGRVEYGTSTSYGQSTEWETSYVTSHSINLGGLNPDTSYHYRIAIKDKSNNENKTLDFAFKTPQ